MNAQAWLKRSLVVGFVGFVMPAVLVQWGAPWLLAGADGPGGFGAYALLSLIVLALWAVTAIYLLVFTIRHFKKSGN